MKSSLDVLCSYAEAFRDLINAKVWSGSKTIRKLLRLSKNRDWNFLCTSMDVVGDASGAIRNFLQFGLDGPTKYQDIGERYLRLYGLLSAAYIQQQAILKLYELMNVPNLREIKAKFDALEIRHLRHKLASHSTDYRNYKNHTVYTYIPIRIGVCGFNLTYTNNETTTHESVNLEAAIEENCKFLVSVMDAIYEKSVRTLYKGQNKKLTDFFERLEDLRIEKEGGMVLRMPQEAKLVINTLGDRNQAVRSSRMHHSDGPITTEES